MKLDDLLDVLEVNDIVIKPRQFHNGDYWKDKEFEICNSYKDSYYFNEASMAIIHTAIELPYYLKNSLVVHISYDKVISVDVVYYQEDI